MARWQQATEIAALCERCQSGWRAVRPDDKQAWVALSARPDQDSGVEIVGLANVDTTAPLKQLVVKAPAFPRELIFPLDGNTRVATSYDANQLVFLTTP